MRADLPTLAAVLGMALATYASRAGGLWLTSHLPPSPRVAAGLRHAPGAV
ncbi:MAG: AzlD domain-containing protein, partial [Gemmatimonadota bacterium]